MYSNEDFSVAHLGATREDVRKVQNEIAFANLFQAAANPKIFELLSEKDQAQLCEILAAYTALNVQNVSQSQNNDAYNIRMYNKYRG